MGNTSALLDFVVRLGDTNLILGHRLSEWCSRGPFLEEDVATANIALDHVGAARLLLTYAGEIEGGKTEDDYAYQRNYSEFKNALLVEQPNGDFGDTQARQLYYSVFAYLLYTELKNSKNEQLAAFATKAIKETIYHLRHCSEWVIRLGDGTEESKRRMQKAVDNLWPYTGDLFATTSGDAELVKDGIIPDLPALKQQWSGMVQEVITRATLDMPDANAWQQSGSREGKHSEHLSYLVAEMQSVARAYPGAQW